MSIVYMYVYISTHSTYVCVCMHTLFFIGKMYAYTKRGRGGKMELFWAMCSKYAYVYIEIDILYTNNFSYLRLDSQQDPVMRGKNTDVMTPEDKPQC